MFRKFYSLQLFLILLVCFSMKANSQALLFSQNFEDTTHLFQEYLLANFDKGIPAETGWASLEDSAWVIRSLPGMNTHAAVATSNYNPALAANDWFITSAIKLGPASNLSFGTYSYDADRPDSILVYISTSNQSVNGCLLNLPKAQFISSQSSGIEYHSLSFNDLGFANQTVYIGFRLATESGGGKIAIDDIQVIDEELQSVASLTFNVNMSKYINQGKFRPATDTVDIAGNFNNWDGTQDIMSIVPGTDSTIYSITLPDFHDGDQLQFKFRINSSWNDTAVEFPFSGPNRLWTIIHDIYTYTAYYNEAGEVSSVPDQDESFGRVKIFPNPLGAVLNIQSLQGIQKLELVSINGQVIHEFLHPESNLIINTSGLSPGYYMVLLFDKKGLVAGRKVLKY